MKPAKSEVGNPAVTSLKRVALHTETKKQEFIIANTRVVEPLLCPEIKLRLITPACPLWSANEQSLAALPISDPYWGFCWAGGQVLARYILDQAEVVAGKRIFVFGAGCGIEAIAALKAGAELVLACDIDPMAAEAAQINALLNNVSFETTTKDLLGEPLTGFDVLLAGDMFYDRNFAERVTAWFRLLAESGLKILIGDPLRGNLCEDFLVRVGTYQAPADVDLYGQYLREAVVFAFCTGAPSGALHVVSANGF